MRCRYLVLFAVIIYLIFNRDNLTDDCYQHNRCQNGGTCVDKINSFSCSCPDGYAGNFCEYGKKCRYPGACAPSIYAGNCHICQDGFVKDPENNTTCKFENTEESSLIISSSENIKMFSLDEQRTAEVIAVTDFVLGTDYNFQTKRIAWFSDSDKAIYTTGLNSEFEKHSILNDSASEINGLAVDWIHNNIYWVDSAKKELCVSSFDGTMKKVLFKDGLKSPNSIAVDPLSGWMYWTDEIKDCIERAGLDGSRREVILSTDIKEPQSIVVDFVDSRLYWSQGWYSSSIWSSDFDGSDSTLVYRAKPSQFRISYFLKIALFDEFVYLIEYYSETIYKVNKCNGANLTVVYTSDFRLWDFKVYDTTQQPGGHNGCLSRLGECSHFCFPVPSLRSCSVFKTKCSCPDGLSLSSDQQSCV